MLRFFPERFPFWIAAIGTSLIFGVAHTYIHTYIHTHSALWL
ncbi:MULTISPECIES: hypothetical protein [Bacillus]